MNRRSPWVLIRGVGWSVASMLLYAPAAHATEPQDFRADHKTLTLQTDLITPFFGTYYLEANVRVTNHISVLLNTSYLTLENGDWKTRTGTAGVGLSYYFQGDAPRRWYIEAVGEGNFSYWRHVPSGQVAGVVVGSTGILVGGYRFVWKCGALLDLAAGVVVLHLPSAQVATTNGFVSSESLTRVYPAAKLGVGWAF